MFSSIRSINRTNSRPIWTRICEDIAIMKKIPTPLKKFPHVDQHFRSDQGMSQLSLAIFIVSETHRKPQKSLYYDNDLVGGISPPKKILPNVDFPLLGDMKVNPTG